MLNNLGNTNKSHATELKNRHGYMDDFFFFVNPRQIARASHRPAQLRDEIKSDSYRMKRNLDLNLHCYPYF